MKIVAIIGSYRRGCIIDTAVDEILSSAKEEGAEVTKIHLTEKQIEFCTNCRICTQEGGARRGACPIEDELGEVLDRIEQSDALVLASPMNFGTVTAVMKRFIERQACYAYWPWGARSPKPRIRSKQKRAVLVASCAAPAFLARLNTKMVNLLEKSAATLGAKTIGLLFIGLAAREKQQDIGERNRNKARLLGKKLASGPS